MFNDVESMHFNTSVSSVSHAVDVVAAVAVTVVIFIIMRVIAWIGQNARKSEI